MPDELSNDISLTFRNDLKDYQMNLNPVKNALEQLQIYVAKTYDLDTDTAKLLTKKIIKDNNPKNPIVTYNNKNEVGDMETVTNTLTGYLKDTIDDGNIIVPSFTNYVHPSKKLSYHSDFLFQNVALRSSDKKLAHKYEQEGDKEKFNYYNTMQNIRKIFNNSVSGAYGSKGTILSNFSAHYTLTSITRCMASIGNITTESIVAGNKYFKDADVTMNYILTVAQRANKNMVERVIDKFKLYIPTSEECMEMILYSSRWYWTDLDKEDVIYKFIQKLQPYERVALMYVNDLWHFKEYNSDVARDLIENMGTRRTGLSKVPLSDIAKAPEGIMNLVHLVCTDDIKGMNVNYKALDGTPIIDALASTAVHIYKTMDKYWLFFKAFFTTDILPTSTAYLKDMIRDSIVLSDTDSTCGAYDRWVQWYFGDNQFHAEAIGIAGAVMTINTLVMDHFIKVFSANMNIDKKNYEILKMKNEFYWHIFVATNAGKHYYANTYVKEGSVYAEDKLERKGVHLIASSIKQDLQKVTKSMLEEILETVKTKQPISLRKWVERIAKIELDIINLVKSGDVSIFKRGPIKEAKSYKNGPTESPYQYHVWWNEHFGDRYGKVAEPPYTAIKIPLLLDNKTAVQEWLDSIVDLETKAKLVHWYENRKAKDFKTLRLPMAAAESIGIPEEFRSVVNSKRIISDNLQPLYMLLESLGFYKKPTLCIYESIVMEESEVEDAAA